MEHVVFYPASDGAPAFRRLASLEEAVRLVEHLRNVEGVFSVSVHALSEVPLSFRTYYRVEVPVASEPVVPALGLAPVATATEPLQVAAVEPLHLAEPLALVEPVHVAEPFHVDVPAQAEAPARQVEEPAVVEAVEEPAESDDSEPAFVIANGRGGPALGFFA